MLGPVFFWTALPCSGDYHLERGRMQLHDAVGLSSSSSSSRICLKALRFQVFIAFTERKNKVPFSMAIGNGELMQECFPKHLRMGTARMK